jgi:hypothetical protein
VNLARRVAGRLCHQAYGAWCQACLRQAGQLNCNPLGIIGGLAVMIGTIEVWRHDRDAWTWVLLLAAPAAVGLLTLIAIRLLEPLVIVSPSPRQQQSAQKQAVREKPVPPGPPSRERHEHVPAAEDIAMASAGNCIPLPRRGQNQAEPELIKEPG